MTDTQILFIFHNSNAGVIGRDLKMLQRRFHLYSEHGGQAAILGSGNPFVGHGVCRF